MFVISPITFVGYQVTDCSKISIEIISVGELSAGEMPCLRNAQIVGETSVVEMSICEMSVGQMSSRRNVLVSKNAVSSSTTVAGNSLHS